MAADVERLVFNIKTFSNPGFLVSNETKIICIYGTVSVVP